MGENIIAWVKIITGLVLVIVLGFLLYKLYGLAKIGGKAGADFVLGKDGEHNVASRATDTVLQSAGVISKDDSLGTAVYNFFHNDENIAAQEQTNATIAAEKARATDEIDNTLPINFIGLGA